MKTVDGPGRLQQVQVLVLVLVVLVVLVVLDRRTLLGALGLVLVVVVAAIHREPQGR